MTRRNWLLASLLVVLGVMAYAPPISSPQLIPRTKGLTAPVPKTAGASTGHTYMMFPYVNTFMAGGTAAFANFGTGINFSNTTMDPFGSNPATAKGSATPQSGSCTVYFYPANTAAGVQTYTTPGIASGGSFAFDVSSNVPGFAGNTGYAIAICDFNNAYGFAEIYDNYGIGAPTATTSYLANILPDPAVYPRTVAVETPTAPLDMMKLLQKLVIKPQ